MDKISSILEKCFQLRERAKNEAEKIKTEINLEHITQLTGKERKE